MTEEMKARVERAATGSQIVQNAWNELTRERTVPLPASNRSIYRSELLVHGYSIARCLDHAVKEDHAIAWVRSLARMAFEAAQKRYGEAMKHKITQAWAPGRAEQVQAEDALDGALVHWINSGVGKIIA